MENKGVPLFELFDSPDLDKCSSRNQIPLAHFYPESNTGDTLTILSILFFFFSIF